ncbi:BlaI/MecI/CopY family transcriptional regulator [uncultured Winogradskyella sp.]|uniref:BlaI/MecI/CopY family transcriptional regulator n=1 Tax=uncultured Winogradskyella sp. TaxID=395353 RepID=UPI002618F8CE|nr:BlaI/MecI/CopY family transcriptional regulator [uncultured Winogradskyella sp.]
MDIKQLNKSELQIMKYLWILKKGFMKDIVEHFPEPRPAYTTISTLLKRMCDKNYIGFERLGRDKQYYPVLKKNEYFSKQVNGMIQHFFNDSKSQFASFFAKNTDLSVEELEELQALLQEKIKQKRNK